METISEMHKRLINIITALRNLGRIINLESKYWKLLILLPKNWESKKNAIMESKNLEKLANEEMLGLL